MRRVLPILLLAACSPLPDTVGEAAPAGTVWQLREIDDRAVPAAFSATIEFTRDGRVRGDGPCNRYSARQTAPLPWFEIQDLSATRRGCPDLEGEAAFFAALAEMDFAEVQGPNLLLSNADGRNLFFRAVSAPGA